MIPHLAGQWTRTTLLTLLPHGGQRLARRNAWAAMSQDAVQARARRDADAAMDLAVASSRRFASG